MTMSISKVYSRQISAAAALLISVLACCASALAQPNDASASVPSGEEPSRGAKFLQRVASLNGMTLYPIGRTHLIDGSVDLANISDYNVRRRTRSPHVQNLTPMKVLNATYRPDDNAVLLTLSLPDGQTKYLWADEPYYSEEKVNPKDDIGDQLFLDIKAHIPKFSQRALAAIRTGSIYRGMPIQALMLSWIEPKKFNNWGLAGYQIVYGPGLYVYVRDDVVTDWQALDE